MEIFNANQSILTEPEIDPFPLDQILPDRPGGSETVGLASPSFILEQLPVITEIDTGDNLLPGHIQQAIAPHIDPPSPPQPPWPAPADPLIGFPVLNQEAIASLGQPGNGVKVEYFDNADFTNKVLTTIVPKIDFDWEDGSPDEAIGSDTFSARWTGKIQPAFTELYTLYVRSDGGVRLWVDGELAIDAWSSEGSAEYSSAIALETGQFLDFTLEYAENTGNAGIELLWSSASQPQQTIPTSALHTSETRPSPEPRTPESLLFHTNSFYNPLDSVKFRGQVEVGDRDLDKIDFRLQKDGGEWVDISDATQLEASDDPDYAFFYYEFSGLEPGQYQLQGIDPQTDSTFTESFTVLSLPAETTLPDSVLHAIARSANLENYSSEELARTQEWVVNLRVGESSAELATALGVRDLGATGHIPNSFIWEFPADVDAMDVASQLSELAGVQFAYPQVPIEVKLLSTPNDPLFNKQWHLKNTGQRRGKVGLDANVTEAWDEVTGEGVVIGIVDDGLQHTHPDLIGNYRPDLSRDFNETDAGDNVTKDEANKNYDRDPAPFSQGLTFDAEMENPEILDSEIPTLYVPLDWNVKVENLKAILDIDNPLPPDVPVNIKRLDGTTEATWELIQESNGSLSYVIDGEFPNDERASGEWQLEVPSGTPGVLNNWSLILDVWYPHGTAVAGVAAASGNNNLGVTGVAPDAELAGLKLIAGSEVYDFQFADALYDEISESDQNISLNQEIDIYNNSWKRNAFDSGEFGLVALEKGVTEGRDGLGNIYVFGAGNDWGNIENVNYNAFANSRYTIAVGAINHRGYKSEYSQEGPSLLISAPSGSYKYRRSKFPLQGMTTTDLVGSEGRNVSEWGDFGDNYEDLDYTNDFGGTSAASPVVSGVVALMLEAKETLTWRDVQHILVETANRDEISGDPRWSGDDTDEIRHSDEYGFGVVDARAAVSAAASWTPVSEEVSFSTGTLTVNQQIPDNLDRVTQTFDISEDITLEWVEVVVNITHESDRDDFTDEFELTSRSDLAIELISPDGTKSVLASPWQEFSKPSEADAGYDNWGLTSVRHWGESSLGEWQLRVTDTRPWNGTVGSWNSWELKIHGTQPTTVSVEATAPIASEDNNPGEFTFTRTGSLDRPLTVNYSVDGTAATGADYQALTGTVEIPAGEESAIARVTPEDDADVEGNETVVVNLVDDPSYAIGTNDSATVTIADNDIVNNPPTLTQTPIEVLTGATEGKSFTISYSELMEQLDATDGDGDPISLEISTIASGRLMKNDVPVEPGVTTLSEGETVVWTPDNAGNEITAFTVRAFDGTDHSAAVPVKVAVTPLPVVAISATDANASEDGDAGEFTVTRSGATTESLEVGYSTAGDATAGSDYATIGDIVIPAGSSEVKVSLDPIDDGEIESSETVVLNLVAGTGYKLGDESSAEVLLEDNDFPIDLESQNLFSVDGRSFAAGDNLNLGFNVKNNEPGEAGPFKVGFYLSQDGTMTTDDRLLSNYEISRLAGNTNTGLLFTNVTLPAMEDVFWSDDGNYTLGVIIDSEGAIAESDEDNNASTGPFKDFINLQISGTQLNQLIDLESQNLFSVDGRSFAAGDNLNLGFNVKNNEPGEAGPFKVGFYLSQDGTMTTDDRLLSNYEISRLAGNTNTGLLFTNVTLPAMGDAFWSDDGNYTLGVIIDSEGAIAESDEDNNASTGSFKDFINLQISGTQQPDLPVVAIRATDPQASEDGDRAQFVVTRTGNTDNRLVLNYSTAGNASAGSDYSSIGNIIIIPAGSSQATVTINPIYDQNIEGDETVVLNLRAGTGYMLGGQSSAQVRITDSPIAGVIHTASYNGHTYHLLKTDGKKWWLEAEREANRLGGYLGGHLVTINSYTENQWVLNTFGPIAQTYAKKNDLPDQEKISIWIGLSDHQNEGTYRWSSGESNRYTNWVPGQPENGADDEDFVGMIVNFGNPGDRGKWHDISGEPRDIDLPFAVVEI